MPSKKLIYGPKAGLPVQEVKVGPILAIFVTDGA